MKKILSALLIITLTLLCFVSCGSGDDNGNDETQKIRIGYLAGPTGMGMAKLIHDNVGVEGNDKYSFTKYSNTENAAKDLKLGRIDVICLPTDEAANHKNTTDETTVVLAINTLNTLFLLSDSETTVTDFSELEGKTIYTCQKGTPKDIIEYLLSATGVNATVSTNCNGKDIVTPQDLGAMIIAGNVDIAVAPEPIVTSTKLERAKNNLPAYSIDINLSDVWKTKCQTEVTMGCIVSTSGFVKKYKSSINAFLTEYKASIEFISNTENIESAAEYIVETGIMGAAPAAKSALANIGSSIKFIEGNDMKTSLVAFYKIIGITAPNDNFYYEK